MCVFAFGQDTDTLKVDLIETANDTTWIEVKEVTTKEFGIELITQTASVRGMRTDKDWNDFDSVPTPSLKEILIGSNPIMLLAKAILGAAILPTQLQRI